MKHSFKKAQSAMEYLMTYGWAILIIAVVLGALFSLGIFSGSAAIGSLCVPIPGFICTSPALATTGNLSFTFGENTGASLYYAGMGCSTSATASGLPNPSILVAGCATLATCCVGTPTACSMVYLGLAGTTLTATVTAYTGFNAPVASPATLANGQLYTVSGLKCWSGGTPILTPAIGTAFSGGIWINYTLGSAAPTGVSGTNPVYSVKFATLNTKVV